MGYHKSTAFCCPFYGWDSKIAVTCEGGKIALPEHGATWQYMREYCADANGWRRCTVARMLLRHYEAGEA